MATIKRPDGTPVEVPSYGLIYGHKEIFGAHYEGNRLDLIKDIPTNILIMELGSLNIRMRQALDLEFDISEDFHSKLFQYFLDGDYEKVRPYLTTYYKIVNELKDSGGPIFFNRPATIFAMQEILRAREIKIDADFELQDKHWDMLMEYYSCVNDEVSKFKAEAEESKKYVPIDEAISGLVFLNELQIAINPFWIFHRFMCLIKYFRKVDTIKDHLTKYFEQVGFAPERFLFHIAQIYVRHERSGLPPEQRHFYPLDESEIEQIKIFNYLSRRHLVKPIHEFDLVEIKKSPFFKEGASIFILMDNGFLLDKIYELFINDFWFDYLKSTGFQVSTYRGIFGNFFEDYTCDILRRTFPGSKCGKELLISSKDGDIELNDFYYREESRVIVGEIKGSGIYGEQTEGFGASLYRSDPKRFYKDFGLTQIIKSLEHLNKAPNDFDKELKPGDKLEVFPIIIFNEKLFASAFIPTVFQVELMNRIKIEDFPNLLIRPISLFHISDIENMEDMIINKKITIWNLLYESFIHSAFPIPMQETIKRTKLPTTIQSSEFMNFAEIDKVVKVVKAKK